MKRVKSLLCLPLMLGLLSPLANGKYELPRTSYQFLSQEKAKSMRIEANKRKAKRTIASVSSDDLMSKEHKAFRDQIMAVKSPNELDNIIRENNKKYDNLPDDLKFLVAQIAPFLTMRGVIYRLQPIIKKERISHSMILTLFHHTATFMKLYFPFNQWETSFDYLTEPYKTNDGKPISQFNTFSEFQRYLSGPVYMEGLRASERIEKLNFSQGRIVWDNKAFFGPKSFPDNNWRFLTVGEPERNVVLSNINFALANLVSFCSYNVESTLSLIKDLGKLFGVDGFLSTLEGAPSLKKVGVLYSSVPGQGSYYKAKYKNLYTLHPGGNYWMKRSFLHLKEGYNRARISREELRDLPSGNNTFLKGSIINALDEFELDLVLKNIEDMLNGPTPIRSPISGEVVTVDIPKFFNDPPRDLKTFLPKTWETGDKFKKKDGIYYRNYFYGRATDWDLKAYKKFLPDLKKSKDVRKAVKVLNQSWGGWAAGLPISFFVN